MRFFLFLFSFFSSFLILPLETLSQNSSLQLFDSLAKEASKISFSQGAQVRQIINQLYQIANQHPDHLSLKWKCMYQEAELHYAQGVYDSVSARRIQHELQQPELKEEPFYNALLHYSLAMNNVSKGSYDEAFRLTLHSMEKFKQLKDSLFIARSLMTLGRICLYIESFHMAKDYYKQALHYTNPDLLEYYQIYSNITIVQGDLDAAVDSLLKLAPYLDKNEKGLSASNYVNIGNIYLMKKEYDKSIHYFTMAKNLSQFIDNVRFLSTLYQNLGSYYLEIEDLDQAYQNFQIAKKIAEHSKSPDLIAPILNVLSLIHQKFRNTDSAYFYLRAYDTVRNEIVKNANPIEVYQSYISAFLEGSKKELIIKEQEVLLNKRRYIVTVVSALAVILLIASWLVILQQQKRHSHQQTLLKEAENKDLEERLQSKQLIEKLQEERIDAQTRELTSFSLALSTKNYLLQQIGVAVKRLTGDQAALDEIRQIIKNNLNTEKTWDDFVLHFEKVHPSFFNRIKSVCNDLSVSDLRLCAYFRIGMSSKQIAQMLNIAPESIKTHRYRIKKKLGLDESQKLDEFIRNI